MSGSNSLPNVSEGSMDTSELPERPVETIVHTQRHRLADKFPMFSVGWTRQGFCRDLVPCWSEKRVVTMMRPVDLRISL